ncbi:hypothetical protein SYNGFB01_01055 [Synechococcus sp. GFB01]|nr:hypothetical protein SYNGFB01_01055 [Synechococcus sp. GFB01]
MKAGFIGRFNAKEHRAKACGGHQIHQLLVAGQIYGGFGIKREWIAPLLHPRNHFLQQELDIALVANEIIIYHENAATPA